MAGVRRYEHHRFVGDRERMVVYDTDDAAQRETLLARIEEADLLDRHLLQAFGPDSLAEARNRGFHAP